MSSTPHGHFLFRKRSESLSSGPPPVIAPSSGPAPPRPPRHPARARVQRRPATSSGSGSGSGTADTAHAAVAIAVTSPFSPTALPSFADFIPLRRRSSKRAASAHPPTPPSDDHPPPHRNLFSTADRTILQELQRGISARNSQFTLKNGQKHHPYPPNEAPYPLNYDRLVIDHDVWETAFTRQLCGSLTFHVFPAPPTKVLDLGCGSGSWILDCARQWRDCEFVGMDLVPIQPDLSHLRSNDLSSRITWVHGNCLEGLPFPNEEFDFVHIKRIAHGVPEDKWDALLEEITRVMKPGAAFEMLEEELFFPGRPRESSASPSPSLPTTSLPDPLPASPLAVPSSPTGAPTAVALPPPVRAHSVSAPDPNRDPTASEAAPSDRTRHPDPSASVASVASSSHRSKSTKSTPSSPTSRSSPPSLYSPLPFMLSSSPTAARPLPPPRTSRAPPSPHPPGSPSGAGAPTSHPSPRPAIHRSISSPAHSRTASPDPRAKTHHPKGRPASSHIPARSPPPPDLQLNPLPPLDDLLSSKSPASRPWKASEGPPASTLFGSPPPATSSAALHAVPSTATLPLPSEPSPSPPRPPQQPQNPRDHGLLEHIYTEMHADRFVNLSPLSLLANALPLYLNDVRTHAPIMFMFPPPAPSPRPKPAKHHARKRTPTSHDPTVSSADTDTTDASQSDTDDRSSGAGTPRPDPDPDPDPSRIPTTTTTTATTNGAHPAGRSRFASRRHSLETNADGRVSVASAVIHGREILHAMQQYVLLDASSPGFLNSGMRHRGGAFATGVGASTASLALSSGSRPRTSTSTARTMFSAQTSSSAATTSTPRTSFSSVGAEEEEGPSSKAGALPLPLPPDRARAASEHEHESEGEGEGEEYPSTASRVNRLPNRMLSFDLQSLNLHLSTRVTEVAACKEAMWEWVAGWQDARRERLARAGAGAGQEEEEEEERGWAGELVDMTRGEFEALVTRFELDMQDQVGLEARMEGTFGWARPPSQGRTAERKAFELLCDKWEEHARTLAAGAGEGEREGEPSGRRRGPRMSRTIRVFCAWK